MPTRFSLLAAAALLVICPFAARCEENATPRPVSVQELSLLLRSGYSGDEVLRETAGRPLLVPIDAAAERSLLDAGADARMVAALRNGRRVVSATEADGVRQQQVAADQHKLEAWEAEQARRVEVARQTTRTNLAARRDEQLGQVAGGLRDKLFVWKNGRLAPYDNTVLAGKKLFLLYASASWCGPCRKLTPQLVEFYKKFAPAHPEFEFVLIPKDRSAADMQKYMKTEGMPWPALAWEQMAQQPDLAALGNEGIPRLVLIDGSGVKIADNVENGKYLDPKRVIDALKSRVADSAVPATAAR